jgi:hypothetical protein
MERQYLRGHRPVVVVAMMGRGGCQLFGMRIGLFLSMWS